VAGPPRFFTNVPWGFIANVRRARIPFEIYYQTEPIPIRIRRAQTNAAGFENGRHSDALDWLNTLTDLPRRFLPGASTHDKSFRGYSNGRKRPKLSLGAERIAFLKVQKVSPPSRRNSSERGMALAQRSCRFGKLRVIRPDGLWTRRGNVDALISRQSYFTDREKRQTH